MEDYEALCRGTFKSFFVVCKKRHDALEYTGKAVFKGYAVK